MVSHLGNTACTQCTTHISKSQRQSGKGLRETATGGFTQPLPCLMRVEMTELATLQEHAWHGGGRRAGVGVEPVFVEEPSEEAVGGGAHEGRGDHRRKRGGQGHRGKDEENVSSELWKGVFCRLLRGRGDTGRHMQT